MQNIYIGIEQLPRILSKCTPSKVLLVCDNAFTHLSIKTYLTEVIDSYVVFHGFSSNPVYKDVVKGVQLARNQQCDFILAVGGGSAIDTAKCIKLFFKMDQSRSYLNQTYEENNVSILAIPTTAGTGSESTRFAVIYANGEKQSVFHDAILPEYVILDFYVLRTLPVYQKKCTMLDALCQAIESWWSINSTEESKYISMRAVPLITEFYKSYLNNTDIGNEAMLMASNLAGQAINITQTTAAHAMSYKLTSYYNIPHGHAAAICLPEVWQYMTENMDKCADRRGEKYLADVFSDIAAALDCNTPKKAISWFRALLKDLKITVPLKAAASDIKSLAGSVNLTRLKNNPVNIDKEAAVSLYKKILNISENNNRRINNE